MLQYDVVVLCRCSSRRHLWVSGTGGSLSKAIKAIDLKDFFSKYGQVGGVWRLQVTWTGEGRC